MIDKVQGVPKEYVWRRFHSLLGLFIVFFLIEHIMTNSQSALLFGESGSGFIRMVNLIKNLPYLPVVEISLIGIPLLFHAVFGIKYALTSKTNSGSSSGRKVSLKEYPRNHAYTWQRITSWILLIGIILHVGYMRFYRYPTHASLKDQSFYFVRVSLDNGLYTVASRLGVNLYSQSEIAHIVAEYKAQKMADVELEKKAASFDQFKAYNKNFLEEGLDRFEHSLKPQSFNKNAQSLLDTAQNFQQTTKWIKALTKRPIKKTEVIAEAKDFGTAILLVVRDSFKSPVKSLLYTVFVLSAAFHAFNGVWTFFMTWGLIIQMRSQKTIVNVCTALMVVIALLGLASVWGTYWINLYR